MFTVFIIGNIASGKSCASRYLAQRGGYRIDLDQMAKDLYLPGSPIVERLASAFGSDVVASDGSIDCAALARSAFATPETVQTLNRMVHPALIEQLGAILLPAHCCSVIPASYPFVVVEISVAAAFREAFVLADEIIAITAPLDIRRARAIDRGMDPQDFDRRAALQSSEEELCGMATRVIDNSQADDSLFDALDAWLSMKGLVPGQQQLGGLDG